MSSLYYLYNQSIAIILKVRKRVPRNEHHSAFADVIKIPFWTVVIKDEKIYLHSNRRKTWLDQGRSSKSQSMESTEKNTLLLILMKYKENSLI